MPNTISKDAHDVFNGGDNHDALFALFREIFSDADNEERVQTLFSDLQKQYQEPHRAYHTLVHLSDLAVEFEKHRALLGSKDEQRAILTALFYHDIIYDCAPGQDEKDSAEYMEEKLSRLIPDSIIARAKDIILFTASHAAPKGDYTAQLFLDMDMSILATSAERYDLYVDQVAHEFCTMHELSHQGFTDRRVTAFLEPILNSNAPIFKTDEYKHLENLAKQNISRELLRSTNAAAILEHTKD